MFFLRAASKDRTTVVNVQSPLPPLEVLNGISFWLEERGWKKNGGNVDEKLLIFNGSVASSTFLAIFLSFLGGLGSACLGLPDANGDRCDSATASNSLPWATARSCQS